MDNFKNKMVEWFECHQTALEDLSNFCGRKSKQMLNEMNKDGTSVKIIGKYLDNPEKYLEVDNLEE